jgi:hypothetical protein
MTEHNNQNLAEEELAVRMGDIDDFRLTHPVLRDRVEEIVQENLAYRQAFRDFDATDINSNVVEIPVPQDDMENPSVVGEGSEFPREQENYTNESLTFKKFGFEVALTHEAQEDSMIDVVRDQVDRQARQMAEEMNYQAFTNLIDGISTTVGDADGVLSYDDLLDGRKELLTNNYDPDLLIADVEAVHDLMGDSNFLEGETEANAEMRRSGAVGRVLGMDVVEADDGNNITGNDHPGAVMVDTDYFGYEGTRESMTSEDYEEQRTQTDVYRVYNRLGWLTIQSNSGVIIEG